MRKIFLACLFIATTFYGFAGAFTPGNLVVVRIGDGSAALTNASTAVFLDEYTPAGILVQSIAAPTTRNGTTHALTMSGVATTEGLITLSANGQYLSIAGYDTTPGYSGVATGVTNRTIGRADATGTINTTTGFISGSAYAAGNFRSVVSNDGNQFWTSGSGSGGIWYVPFGSFTQFGTQTSGTVVNTRQVNIFNGQLYFSANTVPGGIYTDGTGLPTNPGQTENRLAGLPTLDTLKSPFAFLMLDESAAVTGVDVLYAVDEDTTATVGGIYKYSKVGTSWVANGRIPNSNGLRGLTGYAACGGIRLFATAPNGIFTFRDSTGYNQAISGSFTQIVTAGNNTVIRGVAFTPGTTAPTAPIATVSSAANVTCHGGANGAIDISVTGGTAPISYHWTGGTTSQNNAGLTAGHYTVTVTDGNGCTTTVSDSITQPSAISVTDSVVNLPCTGGSTGSISLHVTGGTGSTYTFHWSNNATTQNITGLNAGTYRVVITDSLGCVATDSAIISQSGTLTATDSATAVSCYGLSDGSIALHVTGGTPNYVYHWSNSGSTSTITGLAAGAYTVTISDQAGCVLSLPFSVAQPDSLSLVLIPVAASTHGGTDGAIDLTVAGGTGSYSYSWSNGETTSSLTGVAAGSYCVTVSDQHLCRDSDCAMVDQPTGIDQIEWLNALKIYTSGSYIHIEMSLSSSMHAAAGLYDLSGQKVASAISEDSSAVSMQISDALLSDGCYIVRIETTQGAVSRRIIIMK